jgi:hypothetical protein
MKTAPTAAAPRATTELMVIEEAPPVGTGEPLPVTLVDGPPAVLLPDPEPEAAVVLAAGRVEVTTAEVAATLKEAEPCSTWM